MAATKGNQFWKARAKHGRDKIFKTPELMLEAAFDYFSWVEDNPLTRIQRSVDTERFAADSTTIREHDPGKLTGLARNMCSR